MAILKAFLKGWALVFRFPLFWLMKWAINFVFAFLMIVPLADGINQFLAHRTMAEDLVRNPSLGFIGEFNHYFQQQMPGVWQSWWWLLALFAVVNIAISSGILNGFANQLRGQKASFLAGVRRHFLPLMLMPLGFIPIVILCMGGWSWFSSAFIPANQPAWVDILIAVFTVWCMWFLWLVYDYTRVVICARSLPQPGRRTNLAMVFAYPFFAFFRALGFVLTKPSVWLVALGFLIIQAGLVLGLQRNWFESNGTALLVFGQLVVLARTITGLGLWGSEMTLWVENQTSKAVTVDVVEMGETTGAVEPEMSESSAVEPIPAEEPPADPAEAYAEDDDEAYLLAGRGDPKD